MNALTPANLLSETSLSTPQVVAMLANEPVREGVELLYTLNESIFGAAAQDMVDNGWSVFPQEVCRRPGRVHGATIQWSEVHDLKNRLPNKEEMENWVSHCATLNVACVMDKSSSGVFSLDLDIYDAGMSAHVAAVADKNLGYSVLRREGQFPKMALFFRLAEGEVLANKTYHFKDPETGAETPHAIEIQANGKLMTFHGRHHKTGQYYRWLDQNPQVVGPEAAPEVTAVQVEMFLNELSQTYILETSPGRVGAHPKEGIWTPGKVGEGEVANDGRNQILQTVMHRLVHRFQAEFWAAHQAGGKDWQVYVDARAIAVADAFVKGIPAKTFKGQVKEGTPPCATTGRWAPHLLLQEIAYRLDSWTAFIIKEGKPADHKLRATNPKKDGEPKANPGRVDGDTRQTIQVMPGRIFDAVDAAEKALIESDLGIYQRGGQIVSIGSAPVKTSDGSEVDALKIMERGGKALAEDLSRIVIFETFDSRKGDYKVVHTPPLVVETLQERTGRWNLNVLAGYISAPTLRPDGSLLDKVGYDKATGLVYDNQGKDFPSIPAAPTKEQALEALGKLKHLISTFPFVAEPDRAVILSMLLTACIRRNLPTAPMHCISATTPGSGKSKLQDLASVLATGRRAGVVNQASEGAETEKRVAGFLLSGAHQIAIDNVNDPLDGDLLNSMLTQTSVTVRPLGTSVTAEVPTNALVTATGNNLVVVGDLARRSLFCRLDAGCEHPEQREFANEPVEDAMRDRGMLVAAALTVLRAFYTAGRPAQKPVLGSFEVWSRTVRDTLLWLGEADPVATQAALRAQDPKLDTMNNLITQWAQAFPGNRVTVSEVIERATDTQMVNGRAEIKNKPLFEAMSAVAGNSGVLNPNRLGRWLTAHAGRIVDGCRIVRDGDRHKVALWRLDILEGDSAPAKAETPKDEPEVVKAEFKRPEAPVQSPEETQITPNKVAPPVSYPQAMRTIQGNAPRGKVDQKAVEYARHMAEQRAQV